jgi:NAD(P)H dehydrogenase (quinone)
MTRAIDAGPRILIVVDSWTGHTGFAAERLAAGVREAGGAPIFRSADEATRADLQKCDAFVMGSAVHQRAMTWRMKRFVDEVCEPAWFFDDGVGRVGAVFTTGGGHGDAGGGCEMAQLSMLVNLAALGMVLVPLPKTTRGFDHAGMHWGPTIKSTDGAMVPLDPERMDETALEAFFHHGVNVTWVARRLRGLALTRGPGWPWPEVRAAREREEADRSPDARRRRRRPCRRRDPEIRLSNPQWSTICRRCPTGMALLSR